MSDLASWVRTQIAVRASTSWLRDSGGPVDDDFVGVREAGAGGEDGAGVADADAAAEEPCGLAEGGGEVEGAEDQHARWSGVGVDEDRELGGAGVALHIRKAVVRLRDSAVSPSGLLGLSRALALEVVSYGVTVNVVAPGYVATGSQLEFEAVAAAAGPIGRSGTPDEIAACVMFLAHESASFVTGSVLVADGAHGLPETWPRS